MIANTCKLLLNVKEYFDVTIGDRQQLQSRVFSVHQSIMTSTQQHTTSFWWLSSIVRSLESAHRISAHQSPISACATHTPTTLQFYDVPHRRQVD